MTLNPNTPQDTPQVNQDFASDYVNRHWEVFPVHSANDGKCSCGNPKCSDIGKHPRTQNGFKDASTDLAVIDQYWGQWPDANIGVRTGLASGVVVIDIDPDKGGWDSWTNWQDEHGAVDTLMVATGGGGFHAYFTADGITYETNGGKVAKGIDIRGEGGYAILPPSSHESGDLYEWENETEIKPLPEWLKAKLPRQGEPSRGGTPAPSTMDIQEGQRNGHLTRLGGAARRNGATEGSIQALLLAANDELPSPLSEKEVAGIATSVSRYDPSAGPLSEPLVAKYLNHDGFDVVNTHQLGDGELVIRAKEIRKEKTGIHANVEILHSGRSLGYDTFNVGRSRDRHDLSRRCHARLPDGLKEAVNVGTVEMYLDEFCRIAYSESLKTLSPTLVMGDPNIPVTMLCGDYLIQGGITILFAQPGHGKSYTALCMAISVDAGNHTLWNVKKSKVLYVNLERSGESIQRRIGFCNQVLNLEPNRPLHVFNTKGKPLAAVADSLRRYIERESIEVVFLDSISRSGGGSLINDDDTNRTVDLMNDICPTWLAIAHSPRADSSHVFGSVHWEAGADLMVSLTSEIDGNLMGVGLKVTKSNDTPKRPIEKFVFEFGDNGLVNARKAKSGEFAEIASQPKPSLLSQVIEYLQEHDDGTATEIAHAQDVHRPDVSTLLKNNQLFKSLGKQGVRGVVYALNDE